MQGLITLVVLGSVAAVAIPLALLLEWWSVRAVLALVDELTTKRDKNCRGSALARPALSAARN